MSVKASGKLIFLYLVLLALIAGGYGLFIWFVVTIMKGGAVFGLLFVAIVAGIASFFNPCSFPLLPAYLARYYTVEEPKEEGLNKRKILFSGLAAALGVTAFNVLLGALIGLLGIGFGKSLALAGGDPSSVVRWVRGVIGILLILFGFSQFTGRGINFHSLQPHLKKDDSHGRGPFYKMFSYGFLYTMLGIGCGGPILAALSVYALSVGGFLQALLAFVIYALVMALLMILVSILIAFSKEALLKSLGQSVVFIKKGSGVLLLMVGLFLVISSIYITTFTRILFP